MTILADAVLDLNTGWNAKEPEHLIADRIDLCRRLALAEVPAAQPVAPESVMRAAKAVCAHWAEFGPEHEFGATLDQLFNAMEPLTGFEVRIAGPDDVVPFADELEALRHANAVNLTFRADLLKHPDDMVLCLATVHPTTGATNV